MPIDESPFDSIGNEQGVNGSSHPLMRCREAETLRPGAPGRGATVLRQGREDANPMLDHVRTVLGIWIAIPLRCFVIEGLDLRCQS